MAQVDFSVKNLLMVGLLAWLFDFVVGALTGGRGVAGLLPASA